MSHLGLDPSLEISPRFACGHGYLPTYFDAPTYSCLFVCCGYLLWKLLWVVSQSSHAHLSLSLSLSLSWATTYLLTSSLTLWLVGGLPLWEHSSQPFSCFSFECILVENWGFQQTKRLFSIVTNERCLGPTTTKGVC